MSTVAAPLRGGPTPAPYEGAGSCYLEFDGGKIGRVDVNFLGGPKPVGTFHGASAALVAEKENFGASRVQRWFGGFRP